ADRLRQLPLVAAANKGKEGVVKVLVLGGASPNVTFRGPHQAEVLLLFLFSAFDDSASANCVWNRCASWIRWRSSNAVISQGDSNASATTCGNCRAASN